MKITFLNINSLSNPNKTGTHTFQTELSREYLKIALEENVEVQFSGLVRAKQVKENYLNMTEEKFTSRAKVNHVVPYRYSNLVPVEWMFGKSDFYICDAWMPKKICKTSKVISVIHDLMSYIYPEYYSEQDLRNIKKYFTLSAQNADAIIAVSETTRKDIVKYLGIDEKKIFIVNNGITDVFSHPISIPKSSRIDYKRKYLFYIGDMRKNKNLISAVKGFESYIHDNPDDNLLFYIAGSKKNEYEMLKNYVDENNLNERVKFLGFVSDEEKVLLYQNAYALLFVSEYEGFGIPIIESMASGTPVITSNCSSMKEIAEDAAILVPPLDIAEISRAIGMLSDKTIHDSLIQKGYQCASKYTWKRSAEQLSDLIHKLA